MCGWRFTLRSSRDQVNCGLPGSNSKKEFGVIWYLLSLVFDSGYSLTQFTLLTSVGITVIMMNSTNGRRGLYEMPRTGMEDFVSSGYEENFPLYAEKTFSYAGKELRQRRRLSDTDLGYPGDGYNMVTMKRGRKIDRVVRVPVMRRGTEGTASGRQRREEKEEQREGERQRHQREKT